MKTIVLVRPGGNPETLVGLSADGRYVLSQDSEDIDSKQFYLTDTQTGDTQTVATATSEFPLFGSVVSPDGQFVVYNTVTVNQNSNEATQFIDIFDRATDQSRTVFSDTSPALEPDDTQFIALSPDDQSLFFWSDRTNLTGATGSTNLPVDLFQLNLQTQAIQRVLVGFDVYEGVSAGGKYLAAVSGDDVAGFQLDRVDLTTGDIDVIASGIGENEFDEVTFSADGRFAVFTTAQALLPQDTNGTTDVYLKDLSTGDLQLISASATGAPGNDFSFDGQISADGSRIVFGTAASNVSSGATEQTPHIVIWERATGTLDFVADDPNEVGPVISADGSTVAIDTPERLTAGDTDNTDDIYLIHLTAPALTINPITSGSYFNIADGLTVTISGTSDASRPHRHHHVAGLGDPGHGARKP